MLLYGGFLEVKNFEMADLVLMSYFLGLEVTQNVTRIFLSQEKYVKHLLEKF